MERLVRLREKMSSPYSVGNVQDIPVREYTDEIIRLVRYEHGIDLADYKRNTVCRRILRRMGRLNIKSSAEYISLLKNSPVECQNLLDAVFINYTRFFRDREVFRKIYDTVLPELARRGVCNGGRIRVWSPGCATGEEAYSLGILFKERVELEGEEREVVIFATDIDSLAIRHAREAVFPEERMLEVDDRIRQNYFSDDGNGYVIRSDVRGLIKFGVHDLSCDAPISRIDMITCRNTLIYFNRDQQQKILACLYHALAPGGYLVLGKAEKPGRDLRGCFEEVDPKARIYRKNEKGWVGDGRQKAAHR